MYIDRHGLLVSLPFFACLYLNAYPSSQSIVLKYTIRSSISKFQNQNFIPGVFLICY